LQVATMVTGLQREIHFLECDMFALTTLKMRVFQ